MRSPAKASEGELQKCFRFVDVPQREMKKREERREVTVIVRQDMGRLKTVEQAGDGIPNES